MDPFDPNGDEWAAGWMLQVLKRHQPDLLNSLLSETPQGWFKTESAIDINYGILQRALLNEEFELADRFTSETLRKLAGPAAIKRGYVYFSEVNSMMSIDLTTIDRLWTAYSHGRFSFSVQGRLLQALDGNYERLWPRIGWRNNGIWTRYPRSFTWSLQAPEGHMPLINQLRGVRLMDAILHHPALIERQTNASMT